jgi:hypothetical protein
LPACYGFILLSERQAELRDTFLPAGRETTPWRHQRCPGLAPRAADPFLTPTRGAPPRSCIAHASACRLPTPSCILHGHGGKHRLRVQSVEATSGTGAGTRRSALAQRHHTLVVSSSGFSAPHVTAAAAGLHSTSRMPYEGRVVLCAHSLSSALRFLPRERGGEGLRGHGGGRGWTSQADGLW